MTREEAKAALDAANRAITTAVLLVKVEMETIERFLDEKRLMESIGPILDPTLFRDSEREAVSALMGPIYKSARDFVRFYDAHIAGSATALAAVRERK